MGQILLSAVISKDELPDRFPTHRHSPEFWEELGRTVGTFGFLEEVLGKAIFAFTATRRYSDEEVQKAFEAWLPKLERALTDPLGNLIDVYVKSVKEHPESTLQNLDDLEADLRGVSKLRNALCHGSWRAPNKDGASSLLYVNRRMERFESLVDTDFLRQTQESVAELACEVINTVTHMGWQFPGGGGPGDRIL